MNEYFCTSPAYAPITFVMVRGRVSYSLRKHPFLLARCRWETSSVAMSEEKQMFSQAKFHIPPKPHHTSPMLSFFAVIKTFSTSPGGIPGNFCWG